MCKNKGGNSASITGAGYETPETHVNARGSICTMFKPSQGKYIKQEDMYAGGTVDMYNDDD